MELLMCTNCVACYGANSTETMCSSQGRVQDFSLGVGPKAESGVGFLGRGSNPSTHWLHGAVYSADADWQRIQYSVGLLTARHGRRSLVKIRGLTRTQRFGIGTSLALWSRIADSAGRWNASSMTLEKMRSGAEQICGADQNGDTLRINRA